MLEKQSFAGFLSSQQKTTPLHLDGSRGPSQVVPSDLLFGVQQCVLKPALQLICGALEGLGGLGPPAGVATTPAITTARKVRT